jgi:hypothetical protein
MKTIFAAMTLTAALAVGTSALAAGGCGAGWHRGPWGHCRRNEVVVVNPAPVVVAPAATEMVVPVGRPCPRGYHLGPQGRRCWPN